MPRVLSLGIALSAYLALAGAAHAQSNIEANQGVQLDFLNPGARSLAMGGAFIGLADDATAALANPAGLRALSRTEISYEHRIRQFHTPFVFSGRLSGTPSNSGVDTVSGPVFRTAETSRQIPSFLSGVYASAKHNWTVAGYRHETSRFFNTFRTGGPVFRNESGGNTRYFPIDAYIDLSLVNYGAAGSYKWQSCKTTNGVKTCQDRFAVGGGVSFYDYYMDSKTTRYDLPTSFFAAPVYTTPVNNQFQFGEQWKTGYNIGAMFIPSSRVQVGVSYRQKVAFDTDVTNYVVETGLLINPADRSAEFVLPSNLGLGTSFRLTRSTVVALDYNFVRYSDSTQRFVNVFPSNTREVATNYSAPDANELHIGLEHQFVNAKIAPALRVGTWFDPDHAVRHNTTLTSFLPGKDVWHVTAGGGVVITKLEVNGALDFSDRGNIGSVSAVFRF
ncbi:MAG: outer membrane protein transport protein [Vicinamibacterales bacterium]